MTSRRTALITGGAQGIGAAIARRLAADGLAVVIVDLLGDDAERLAAELRDGGADALAIAADVADTASVEAVADRCPAIDVLVNNAGWDDFMPFVATDEAFWDRVLEINFKGALRCTHRLLPGMAERGWGRIVNVASDAGRIGAPREAVYSGAKGALIAFTKTIARETARTGVTANCVCPGPTDTSMLRHLAHSGGDGVVEAMIRAVPMRRLGTPEDVAPAVSFLAGERAGYITGQTLSVSGGLTMA
jgi:2-hydroxycyclohexanecarboxyl-CoA dehydrogenase